MKTSLGTSLVIHSAALTLALFSLGAPAKFEVAPVEALPVDIIPVESITQIQQGEKTAPMSEKASPKPTKKTNVVDNAENSGENDVDLKNPPTPAKRPVQTETAASPQKVEKPLPNPTNENNKVKDVVPEETAPKPVETASLPQPKPEIQTPPPKPEAAKPTPAPTPTPAETKAEEAPLPDSVPLPAQRPKPEPPKEQAKPVEKPPEKPVEKAAEKPTEKKTDTAKATEKASDKKVADKKQETAKTTASGESDFNPDDIKNLLNKQEAAGGGAKRSTQTASLGGKTTTGGNKLSMSEMDALRGQIQNNWSTFAGLEGLQGMIIRVKFSLDQSGAIIGNPEVSSSGGSDTARRTMEASARRAVLRSQPFQGLPADKYDSWSEVVVNFDPSDMGL